MLHLEHDCGCFIHIPPSHDLRQSSPKDFVHPPWGTCSPGTLFTVHVLQDWLTQASGRDLPATPDWSRPHEEMPERGNYHTSHPSNIQHKRPWKRDDVGPKVAVNEGCFTLIIAASWKCLAIVSIHTKGYGYKSTWDHLGWTGSKLIHGLSFMLDEWEVCSYTINSLLLLETLPRNPLSEWWEHYALKCSLLHLQGLMVKAPIPNQEPVGNL